MNDFSTTFTVDQAPDEVFAAINDVRSWWTGDIAGGTSALGDEFTYRHQDVHRSTQRVTELVPGKRVEWLVTDAHLSFTEDPAEWTGTRVVFDIGSGPEGTEVRFTHVGLSPDVACYESCSSAWGFFVNGSLRSRITAG
jgi:uncharacterized protein YndB with AHSA1/START domain